MGRPSRRRAHPDRLSDAAALFACLAFLLAAALLAHQLWWNGFEVLSPRFAVVLAALWTMLRPASVARFLTLLATEAVVVGLDMPAVHSHVLLVLITALSVLAYAGARVSRTRRLPEAGELFARVAPFLRLQLVVVYLAAALSKLNSGFLDPATSCAAGLSARIAWFDPSLLDGAWRVAPAIWGTVLIELALPLLLAVPRTRLAGLVLGAGFHSVLALAGNVPFSALVLAFYVAFLPADTPSRVRAVARLAVWAPLARSRAAFPVAVGAWIAAAVLLDGERELTAGLVGNGTRVGLVLAILAAGAVLVRGLRSGGPPVRERRSLRPRHPVFAVGIAVLLLNCASPYLGFKTESSFAMFSNLQTEAGEWNHLLIPEAVRVLPHQDDLVRVLGSSDRALARRGGDGRLLVRYELERYLRLRPGADATVASASGAREVRRLTAAGTPAPAGTWLVDRVAKFRDVRPPGARGC